MVFTEQLEKCIASQDFLCETLTFRFHELIEHEVATLSETDSYERFGKHVNHRNGYWKRPLDTQIGRVDIWAWHRC
ncbi:hypothetical protein DYI26_12410 [Halomonas litopenaei]|nr:hypothetical protein [Halomonas litopenaei]